MHKLINFKIFEVQIRYWYLSLNLDQPKFGLSLVIYSSYRETSFQFSVITFMQSYWHRKCIIHIIKNNYKPNCCILIFENLIIKKITAGNNVYYHKEIIKTSPKSTWKTVRNWEIITLKYVFDNIQCFTINVSNF